VLVTHLHSDHTVGYPDLISTPWVLGRRVALEVYGPNWHQGDDHAASWKHIAPISHRASDSTGLAIQDLAAAEMIYRRATRSACARITFNDSRNEQSV
jgi:ribonuclease BN (tRNA processing enzyme)